MLPRDQEGSESAHPQPLDQGATERSRREDGREAGRSEAAMDACESESAFRVVIVSQSAKESFRIDDGCGLVRLERVRLLIQLRSHL